MTGTEHRGDEAADGDGTPSDAPQSGTVGGRAALKPRSQEPEARSASRESMASTLTDEPAREAAASPSHQSLAASVGNEPGCQPTAGQAAPLEPPVEDSAYSWVIVGAASLQFVLVGGIHKSFGLVLAALVQRHGFTAAQVSIIPATYIAASFLVAPLCGALCRRLSERSVAMLGGLCSTLGLAISALTSGVHLLYLTNGLIFGVGQGCNYVSGTLLVTQYFVKRRGLLLLEEYGIPGTYLMLGGLHMHTLVSAALYRPLEKQRMIMRLDRRRCLRRVKTADRLSVLLFSAGLPHVLLLVPRFGLEIGISRGRTANMIATVAPIDILSRLSLGLLLDRNLFHKRYGFFITCLVGGAGILALVFVRTYAGLYVACAFVYAGIGFFFVVMPVMYAEYYGVERLSSTLTMSNMFSGMANLVAQPLCGLLRDSTGSFRPVFGVLAACMLTGGAVMLTHPCIERTRHRNAGIILYIE
ncbi:monocarboxylate transporter 9-like [Pollicipes pollicipes]|uniref:monocarboxylate transporter 9-like n=1 Tax=Pollicipes pollicipes TaxID=41117 RepID=UPI001884D1ED|nr:monocarboxylate transporter 9-like [Pollicipes pollicipes]